MNARGKVGPVVGPTVPLDVCIAASHDLVEAVRLRRQARDLALARPHDDAARQLFGKAAHVAEELGIRVLRLGQCLELEWEPEPGLVGPTKATSEDDAWASLWLRAGERQMRRIAQAAASGKAGPMETEHEELRILGRQMLHAAALIIDPLR